MEANTTVSDVKRLAGTVLPAGTKVPSGGWVCKNQKCNKLNSGPRKTACDYCGTEKVSATPVKTKPAAKIDNAKRGPGRPRKVEVSAPLNPEPPVAATVPDPYTFSVAPHHRDFYDNDRSGARKPYEPRVSRHTATLNPAIGVAGKDGKPITPERVDRLANFHLQTATEIELPDLTGLELREYTDEELNNDNRSIFPYVERVEFDRRTVLA